MSTPQNEWSATFFLLVGSKILRILDRPLAVPVCQGARRGAYCVRVAGGGMARRRELQLPISQASFTSCKSACAGAGSESRERDRRDSGVHKGCQCNFTLLCYGSHRSELI